MANAWFSSWSWLVVNLRGKKTYLLTAVVLVVVGYCLLTGRMSPTVASSVLSVAIPLYAATFRDALSQLKPGELLDALTEVAAIGNDLALHHYMQAGQRTTATVAAVEAELGSNVVNIQETR